MRITSNIPELPPHLIRRLCEWHCAESHLGISTDSISHINVTWKDAPRDDYYSGEFGEGKRGKKVVSIRLGRFPKSDSRGITDRLDAIVHLTAWALMSAPGRLNIASLCRQRVDAFNADRDNLLAEWYCPAA